MLIVMSIESSHTIVPGSPPFSRGFGDYQLQVSDQFPKKLGVFALSPINGTPTWHMDLEEEDTVDHDLGIVEAKFHSLDSKVVLSDFQNIIIFLGLHSDSLNFSFMILFS